MLTTTSLPTLTQIQLAQRQNRLHVSNSAPYIISQEQYAKIHADATLTHEEGAELLRACLTFNRLSMESQIAKEVAFFSVDQRFDIFMDGGMIVVQDEDYLVRYRLFDKSSQVMKLTTKML